MTGGGLTQRRGTLVLVLVLVLSPLLLLPLRTFLRPRDEDSRTCSSSQVNSTKCRSSSHQRPPRGRLGPMSLRGRWTSTVSESMLGNRELRDELERMLAGRDESDMMLEGRESTGESGGEKVELDDGVGEDGRETDMAPGRVSSCG